MTQWWNKLMAPIEAGKTSVGNGSAQNARSAVKVCEDHLRGCWWAKWWTGKLPTQRWKASYTEAEKRDNGESVRRKTGRTEGQTLESRGCQRTPSPENEISIGFECCADTVFGQTSASQHASISDCVPNQRKKTPSVADKWCPTHAELSA